jgi:hypothetical protein
MTIVQLVDTAPQSAPALPREDALRRARLADRERHEAARTLTTGNHKLDASARCPVCQGPVVIGETVRIIHASSCARRAAMARARAAAAAGAPVRRPAATVTAVARANAPEPDPARREEERPKTGSPRRVNRAARCRIRPTVIHAWRVNGCRVKVDGWPATVRGEIRMAGKTPAVRLDFDDYESWTREDHDEIPEWWELEDLIRPQHACAA